MQNGQDDATQTPAADQEVEPQSQPGEEPQDSEQQPTSEQESKSNDDDADTFPRAYVERLRSEAADYRTTARQREEDLGALKGEVWALRVAASGRLADPTDLPLPDDTDTDADTVEAAITELLERKPHLAARRASGDIGQHERRSDTGGDVNLAELLNRGA